MIRVHCRGTTRSTPLVLLAIVVASLGFAPAVAHANTIGNTQTEIEDLTSRLARIERTSEITSNEYDAAKVELATITANIKVLQSKERGKRAAIKVTAGQLETDVVRAYVLGAANSQIIALFNQNATSSDARTVYENDAIGNLNKLKRTYQSERTSLDGTIRLVGQQRIRARQQTYDMESLLAENIHNENTTRTTLLSATRPINPSVARSTMNNG